MTNSIDDHVGDLHESGIAKKAAGKDMKYPDTRITRAAEKTCNFLDKYLGNPVVYVIETIIYSLHKIGAVKYLDCHGNITDREGNIIQRVTSINQGRVYQKRKKFNETLYERTQEVEGDSNASCDN